jgi:site-specific recombinase XerD
MSKRGWIKSSDKLKRFADENVDLSNKGAYRNLMEQLNKVAKHSKGVSITTQRQYYNHMDQFCRFAADNYNLKTLSNIHNKHLVAYVLDRQNEGKSAAAVKQDLAAIRYFHNQLTKTRNYLGDNKDLTKLYPEFSLEKRRFGGISRRCTESEYKGLVALATSWGKREIATIIQLTRNQGLRIHEAIRMDRLTAEKALRDGLLTIKGKGGLVREIPLRKDTRSILTDFIKHIPRGQKLFVNQQEKAHTVIQRVQDFVRNHRDKVYDIANDRPLGVEITVHSFRHAYAKEQYENFLLQGFSEKQARYQTSLLIGHSREDVTRIYLGE